MSRDPMEVLSACLDGEEADPLELAEALTLPGSREALRDFALLRADVRDEESRPGPEFYSRMERVLGRADRGRWWSTLIPVPAPALAAMLLVAVGLGLWGGWGAWRGGATRDVPGPPEPDRVIYFQEGVDWSSVPGDSAV